MNAFLEEIYGQGDALGNTLASVLESGVIGRIGRLWNDGNYRSIILTGMGSSDFIASSGALLLRSKGLPAASFNAGELLHYPPEDYSDILTVCISQSGESYEIVRLLPSLKTVIGICNEPSSTLGKRADALILTKAGKEEMTSTKTFVTSWMAMLLLCQALSGEQMDLSKATSNALSALKTDLGDIVDFLGDSPSLEMVARGPQTCAAAQSALMWMEAAHVPACAMNGGNFRHGPLEMVKPGMAVFIFTHSLSPTYSQSLRLARDVLGFGGKVVLLTDILPPLTGDRLRVFASPCLSEETAPISNVIPVQLIVNAWACAHGMTPGDFAHGAKVTTTE